MKTSIIYKKIAFFGVILVLLSSCSDLLNTEPITDEISPPQDEQLIKTAAEAELAMKSCNASFGIEY